MEQQTKDERISLQELSKRVREVSLQTPIPENRSAVLFVGQTLDGKSTLLAYLNNSEALKAVEDENDDQGRLVFTSNDSENDHGIGQGVFSHTTMPTNHDMYWDLPGIAKDTRGPDQDIVNAWSIRSLCMHIERIKIVFVVSEENLKYLRLIEIAKAVTEVFPNIDQNLSSLCMVITKKQNTSIDRFREILKRALAKEKQNLNLVVYNLLEFFSQEGPIVSFSRPTTEGMLTQHNERQEIISVIENAGWYEKPKIGPGISTESKYVLIQLKSAEIDEFSQFIKENFEQMLNNYMNKVLSSYAGNAENLRVVLKNLWSNLDALNKSPLKLEDSLDKLQDLSLQMNEEKLKEFVLSKQKTFGFLAQLESDPSKVTARDVAGAFTFLNPILKFILLQLRNAELADFSQFIKENFGQMLKRSLKEILDSHSGSEESLQVVARDLRSCLDTLNKSPLKLEESLDKLEDLNLQMKEERLKNFVSSKKESFKFLAELEKSLPKLENDRPLVGSIDVADSFSFLGPTLKFILLELKKAELNEFSQFMMENFDQMLNKYVNEIISSHTGSAETLQLGLKNLQLNISVLKKFELQDSFEKIKDLSLQVKEEKLEDFILRKQKSFGFLCQLESDPSRATAKNVTEYFSFLDSIINKLSKFQKAPEKQWENKTVRLKGRIIRSKHINEALSRNPGISEIDVDSSHVIFIDANIKFPGGKLSLNSPQVQVVRTPEIDLSGREGPKHERLKARARKMAIQYSESQAQSGKPGLTGRPGEKGGIFDVKTENFKNSKNLKVNVSGGRGGQGQGGGDGANGVKGREEIALEKVRKREEVALKSSKQFVCQGFGDYAVKVLKIVLTYNTKFIHEYSYSEIGQLGGDAGLGGEGGPGGNPGEVSVGDFPLREMIKDSGPKGLDGPPGNKGIDGKNGPEYRGVYLEEKIFSGLRRIKTFDRGTVGNLAGSGAQLVGVTAGREAILGSATADVVKNSLKLGVKVAKVGAASTLGASIAIGVGICATIQGLGSVISAKICDEWIEEPHRVDQEDSLSNEVNEGEDSLLVIDEFKRDELATLSTVVDQQDQDEN